MLGPVQSGSYIWVSTVIVVINALIIIQCKGKDILWSHLMRLYHRDAGAGRPAPGLAMAKKLKREHAYLTSFSKIRVHGVGSTGW